MRFKVYLTHDASRDLEEIFQYIAAHDAPGKAAHVMDSIEKNILSLADHPNSGAYPKELLALGLREWREIFFKPYRVVYRVQNRSVFIHLIADGRRDMQTLLQRRLFGI